MGNVNGVRKRTVWYPRDAYSEAFHDHPFTKSVSKSTDAPVFNVYSCNKQYDYTTRSNSSGYPNYATNQVSPWGPNEDTALLGKLRVAMGAEFDLTVFLGEGKEALQTIASVAGRVYLSYKKLRRADFVGAMQALGHNYGSSARQQRKLLSKENIAARHLEWTYAVRPLLDDVFNAAQHLAYMQERPATRVYRVSKKVNGKNRIDLGVGAFSPVNWVIRKQLIAKVTHVNEARLVGLTNPAAVAWELMPWSFVADWFIPIGNYIQAIGLMSSLTGTFITSAKDERSCYGYFSVSSSTKKTAYFYRYDMSFSRSVGTTIPRPDLPTLKPLSKSLTFTHALNAVSLLTSKFAGKH